MASSHEPSSKKAPTTEIVLITETLEDTRSSSVLTLIKTRLAFLFLFVLVMAGYYAAAFSLQNDNASGHTGALSKSQVSPHHSPSMCSCYSDTNSEECCERTIWRTHKFGTILLGDLFQEFRQSNAPLRIRTKPTPKSDNYTLPVKSDYRHVMVTRDWFDSIVSGYLYHKAGYECWIDYRGSDKETKHPKHWDMEMYYHNKYWDTQQLTFHQKLEIPHPPPRNNRSLCSYLEEETEEDGIKVIMDVALSRWYKGVVPYYEKTLAKLQRDQQHQSLFLCYEDLVDPFQQEEVFHDILQHMFPGRNTSNVAMPGKMKASLIKQQQNDSVYSGGHASAHDPKLRARLRKLVERYDDQLFNNTIASSNTIFGCGSKT